MGTVVVTIANPGPDPVDYFGSRKVVFGTLHLSTSYATGGDSYTAGQFGMERIDMLEIAQPGDGNTTSWMLAPILPTTVGQSAAGKIQAFGTGSGAGALAEAGNIDLSSFVANFLAIGF